MSHKEQNNFKCHRDDESREKAEMVFNSAVSENSHLTGEKLSRSVFKSCIEQSKIIRLKGKWAVWVCSNPFFYPPVDPDTTNMTYSASTYLQQTGLYCLCVFCEGKNN